MHAAYQYAVVLVAKETASRQWMIASRGVVVAENIEQSDRHNVIAGAKVSHEVAVSSRMGRRRHASRRRRHPLGICARF